MPRVSVVIPLYQTEFYIKEALDSVVEQTFTDFEVLVIDDGSRDEGPDIARSYSDERITVITQKNRGLSGARNTGIRHAKGEFVALLDADDIWDVRKLEKHVAHFDSDPSIDISFSSSKLIDEASNDVGLIQRPITDSYEAVDFFCRNPVGNGSALVLRRSAFDRIEFEDTALGRTCWFDESFRQSEDIECWMRLAASARCRFAHIDEPLTLYRVNGGGLSANVPAHLASWHKFRDAVARYAPDLVARYGRRAEAYQLRFLARRAVQSDARLLALTLTMKSFATYPRVVIEEPMRSLSTLGAALAKSVLTDGLFERLQGRAMRAATARPGLRL